MRFSHPAGRVVLSLLLATASAAPGAEVFDVIVKGGTILDGTALDSYPADVGIRRGRIVRLGDLSMSTAALEIDAKNLFVAPGFVNIHDHPEADALFKAENVLTQGITTEIGNPDGAGSTDLATQARTMAAKGLATNLGLYIGFNAVWAEVMGNRDVRPDAAGVARMQALIVRGLEQGAWGVSAALDYKPAYFARMDEVIRVVSVAAPWRTNFPNHERLTPETGYSGLAGVKETLEIGVQAGLVPVFTHMKSQGREQRRAKEQLDLMDEATRAGHFTAGDIYPYTYGFNNVSSLLIPAWAHEGGEAALFARFKDPTARARIVQDVEQVMARRWNGPSGVYVVPLERELTDLMREWGVSAGEAIVRLNEQHGRLLQTYLRFGIDEDVIEMLRHPNVAVACDCGSLLTVSGHPRAFGTFPLVLRRYVREMGVLTWEDAIRKMTGLPASIIGMTDRGLIAPGMAADVMVFDPHAITDRGTAASPQLAEGVRYVLVNGHLALSNGRVTGQQGGAILKRAPNMPSRPLGLSTTRRITGAAMLKGEVAARMKVELRQDPRRRSARGGITVKDADGRTVFVAQELGVLQMTSDWGSITGEGRLASGELRAFTLIVDQAGLSPTPGRKVQLSVDSALNLIGDASDINLSLMR